MDTESDDLSDSDRSTRSVWLPFAVYLTLAGGVVSLVCQFKTLPVWLLAAGMTAFLVGAVTSGAIAFRHFRRDGTPILRSLGRAVDDGFWLVFGSIF